MVYYRQGVMTFDENYKDNGRRCKEFVRRHDRSKTHASVSKMCIYASASPEGSVELNEKLAKGRAQSAIAYLHNDLDFADSLVFIQIVTEDWEGLEAKVVADQTMKHKEEALSIIRNAEDPDRKAKLMRLEGGSVWNYLYMKYFAELRSFKIYVYFSPDAEIIRTPITELQCQLPAPALGNLKPVPAKPAPAAPQWTRELTLKTNLIGIGMGHANIAAEIDLAPHWSVAVPFYYSGGFDYFKPTIKFRGIVLQPQARYYFKGNDGWYVGAHVGLGWYNFALDGEFRIQDYKGRRPAWGGGLGAGYSLQFKKNPRWGMEFALGAGVYDVKYDIFYNEHNGPYAETGVHDTFFGIDNASIAFTYKFDLKRKEDRR